MGERNKEIFRQLDMLRTRKIICGVWVASTLALPSHLKERGYLSSSSVPIESSVRRRFETLAFLISIQEMSQIDITVLKQGTRSKKILSCSFFQMSDPYRDFSKYERSFKNFLQQVPTGFELRIYVDDTTKEFVLKHATQPSATILHFDCPEFREGVGHTGTFGTFPRFLPLFEKDHDVVWVTDIDIPDSYLNPQVEKATPDAMIHTYICYERKV